MPFAFISLWIKVMAILLKMGLSDSRNFTGK